jgi:AcrR family transcriptional regulator
VSDLPDNETRQRLLEAAEELFATRGYSAVKLRDIAKAINIKHGSLYYYAPKGKEQLFLEVFAHSFERHQSGLHATIAAAGDDVQAQLYAIADWFAAQPAMDMNRIQQGDRPDLSADELQRLADMAYDALRIPIVAALSHAQEQGVIRVENYDLAAMALISMAQSTQTIPHMSPEAKRMLGHKLVDMIMNGWRPR